MASITFRGEAHGPGQTIGWHGRTFRPHEAVETDHPALIAAAKANPFFEVSGADAPPASGEEVDDVDEEFGRYDIKHRGRGSFAVMLGDEVIAKDLTRDEAEAHARDLAASERSPDA